MIIVSIGGGLGNQMFEYAFYEMLKQKYPQVQVKLDIMHTWGHAHNGYELERIFGCKGEDCTTKELLKLSDFYPKDGKLYKLGELFFKVRRKVLGERKSCIKQEDFTEFDDKFYHLNPEQSYYLWGVFSNCHYWSGQEQHIRQVFTFPEITEEHNKVWMEKIKQTNSVSMHIRHGDYVSWGIKILGEDYYRTAMNLLEEKVGDCQFYVFTDDPEYVRNTYGDKKNLVVVEGNSGANSYRDMQLMSCCKHNIVANSTFSFWGAFLNDNPDKIVIASKEPYTGCKEPFACDDWMLI